MTSDLSIAKEAYGTVEEIKLSHYRSVPLGLLRMLSMFLWVPSLRRLMIASNCFLPSTPKEQVTATANEENTQSR